MSRSPFRPRLEPIDERALPSGTLSINDVVHVNHVGGQTAYEFTVRLSEANSKPVSVRYATEDGTAKSWDRDYSSASGTLQFAPGETVKTITVMVRGDAKWELDETFAVRLSRPSNAVIADAIGIGTILRDEGGGSSPGPPSTDPDPNPPGDGF